MAKRRRKKSICPTSSWKDPHVPQVLKRKGSGRPSAEGVNGRITDEFTEEESMWLQACDKYRTKNHIRCMHGIDYLRVAEEYFGKEED